ncbi:hypothetical protein DEI81_09110 [Curtobacterium sp. MCBD17_013]|nr:hypothetical protein DEI81_09110 [Curtobacterium sp. MCBD17_013]
MRAASHLVSERRVWRLYSTQRHWSLHAKKRGLNRKAGPPVHDDRVQRAFTAPPDIDRLWLTDISEHNTSEGRLYLYAVKDACSRRIVGYAISDRMRSSLAGAALQMAVHRRNPVGTVVHPDRGSQGGFNWSSQHLDRGGVPRWRRRIGSRRRARLPRAFDVNGGRIVRCGRPCALPGVLSPRGQCSGRPRTVQFPGTGKAI